MCFQGDRLTKMVRATFMVSTWTVMALAMAAGARSSLPPDRWLPSPEIGMSDVLGFSFWVGRLGVVE